MKLFRRESLGAEYERLGAEMAQAASKSPARYYKLKERQSRIFAVLDDRNQKGRQFEKTGKVDRAVAEYEKNVQDEFFGTLPYDRLRIIYTRDNRLSDAIRVCEAYLKLPDRPRGQAKAQFRQHRDKLRARLEKQTG